MFVTYVCKDPSVMFMFRVLTGRKLNLKKYHKEESKRIFTHSDFLIRNDEEEEGHGSNFVVKELSSNISSHNPYLGAVMNTFYNLSTL